MTAKHGDVWRSKCGRMELRCGDYREVLADVEAVDSVITDTPYSPRTDKGYRTAKDYERSLERGARRFPRRRHELSYAPIDRDWAHSAVGFWAPRTGCWFVGFGDHESARWWEREWGAAGWVVFAPVGWVRTDGPPRFAGDGPASSIEWITVARPKGHPRQKGSRPGYYQGSIRCDRMLVGGKPTWLMSVLVRDYSRPGDLVCDPCAGGGTTLLAAAIEGRRAIGAELDPETYEKAVKRLSKGYTPTLQVGAAPVTEQLEFGTAKGGLL